MLCTSIEEKPLHPSGCGRKKSSSTQMPGDLVFLSTLSLHSHKYVFGVHHLKTLSTGFITIYDSDKSAVHFLKVLLGIS